MNGRSAIPFARSDRVCGRFSSASIVLREVHCECVCSSACLVTDAFSFKSGLLLLKNAFKGSTFGRIGAGGKNDRCNPNNCRIGLIKIYFFNQYE